MKTALWLQDSARELDFSSMTVSRVLNRSEGTDIAKETERYDVLPRREGRR